MAGDRSSWFGAGLPAAVLLAVVAVTHAQAPLGADVEVFGEPPAPKTKTQDVVRPAANLLLGIFGAKHKAAPEPKTPKVEGMEHVLLFQDGRQMRGNLVELTKDEVIWSRVDVSQPLRFGRKDVRRIALRGGISSVDVNEGQVIATQANATKKIEATSSATMKLGGADWLHGEVASADGQTFSVQLTGTTSFSVTRDKVAWLHYGKTAVAGFGLDIGTVDAWTVSGGAVEDAKEGRLRFKENNFVAKTMSPPKRFEVSFEAPKDASFELWFQPFTPRPNSYSTGTFQLSIQEKELERCMYENGFKRDKVAFPSDAPEAKDGWHKYRVFYDGLDRKVTVMRDGKQAAEWALADELQPGQSRELMRGLCFNPKNNFNVKNGRDLVIGNVRFQPWDGDFTASEKPASGDRLSLPRTPTEVGKVTAIAGTKLQFSGAEKELLTGTFLKLGEPGAGLADADAMLLFGRHGELSVASLNVREGHAKFRTGFAAEMDFELKVLDTIAFSGKGGESVAGDVLVFKNGDELPGKLLATGNGAAVKWKTPAGFEVEIQPARVAGVRFAVKPLKVVPPPGSGVAQSEAPKTEKPKPEGGEPKPSPATLELKNGDRFPGELVAVGKDSLRFKHAVLGEREIPRSELWSYFTTLVTDGSATWMDVDPESSARRASTPDRWITLDGAYFTRAGTATPGYSDYSYLSQNGLKLPPRYEVRCDATSFGPNEPYFTIMLSSKTGSSQLNFSFSYNELNISGYSQRANVNGRSFSAEVPLRGKLEPSSRRMMRLLVDSEKGTVAVLLDGVLLKKVGTKKDEMFVGLGNSISFSSYSGYSLTKLSNFWIGPWSGELPDFSKEKTGSVALTNGDVAAGQILALNEGKMRVETEVGEFEMPMERVSSVEFGGTATPAKAAGRLRMRDGAVFHVDEFVFDADSISGKSTVLGEMKFPVTDISELIISPPMVRFPFGPVPKKPAEKPAEAAAVVDPAAPKDLPAQ